MEQPTLSSRVQPDDNHRKVDRFSSLPPELVDHILELVTLDWSEFISPPSKRLLPHWERAFYKSVQIRNTSGFESFSRTLDFSPRKALIVKSLSYGRGWPLDIPPRALQFDVLSKLPALVDLAPARRSPPFLEEINSSGELEHYLANLETCRLDETEVTSALVKGLSLLPKLRRVELSSVSLDPEGPLATAKQVTEVLATRCRSLSSRHGSDLVDPSSFLRFFPSAKIVSLDFNASFPRCSEWIEEVLPPLAASLRTLRLRYDELVLHYSEPFDYISNFTLLRQLELPLSLLLESNNSLKVLSPLHQLVSLTLVIHHLNRDVDFFQGPDRPRSLRHLTFVYEPINEGYRIDLEVAKREPAQPRDKDANSGRVMYEIMQSIEDMPDWDLYLHDNNLERGFYETDGEGGIWNKVSLAEELERVAKGVGIVVDSNLHKLQIAVWHQLLEYHSRGVVRTYLEGDPASLEDARELAELHGIALPPLEISLGERLHTEDLEYDTVTMTRVFGDVNVQEWDTYKLRYKEEDELWR
ncbi:uncharacterized protein JCM6883_000787 [Sporobolomyces salmoneus]|uniref:uncharacterized protein n=1 Tax=Sporobolomyces salmoneus TaxID=183962 RepID=UPI0031821C61